MLGCAGGQFRYNNLTNPISLQANTSYYLATQEVSGGDQWYDSGTVSPASDATLNSSVYSYDGTNWISIGTVNTSYVPLNFLYTVGVSTSIAVSVQANPPDRSFIADGTTYTVVQKFNWTSASAHTLAVTSPQDGAAGIQYAWNSWSDGGAVSHTVSPASATAFTANFTTRYLVTTGVSPFSGGSIAASPSSATGYYDSGTPVQLTANPNAACIFTSWSGDVTGISATLPVTMSGPLTVTANFQCSASASTNFLKGYALSGQSVRNDFSGWVGMKFTVGGNSLLAATLGRICVPGNSGTHTIKFVNAITGIDVSGGSILLSMSGCAAGQFVYGALTNPIALLANTSYYLVSQEAMGGDQWYDYGTISPGPDAAVNSSVYFNGTAWIGVGSANTSYVPPNFQYSVGVPDNALVTGYFQNSERNDFNGWVGMEFTVGASGMTVSSLGRLFLPGNSGTHTVKLVRASDGTDVPGGSVPVSMAGGSAGLFSYAPLASSITLLPNTAYYLVSQEILGGDQWYDYGPVSTTSAGTVNNAVYSMNGAWMLAGGANMSYVPPNLK